MRRVRTNGVASDDVGVSDTSLCENDCATKQWLHLAWKYVWVEVACVWTYMRMYCDAWIFESYVRMSASIAENGQ